MDNLEPELQKNLPRRQSPVVLRPPRIWLLLALLLAVLALVALSAGLTDVQLQPGDPILLGLSGLAPVGGVAGAPASEWPMAVFRIVMLLAVVLLPAYLIYAIFSRQARRQVLSTLIAFAVIVLVLGAVSRCVADARPRPGDVLAAPAQQQPEDPGLGSASRPDVAPPDWLVTTISILVACAVVGVVAGVVWLALRRRNARPTAMEQLAQGAQNAIDALRGGAELRSVIMRCYHDMGRVLQAERGIARPYAMTPREFEQVLHTKGLPAEPVRELTRLFENARYGDQDARPQEERLALDSLAAIAAACRSLK